MPNENNDIHIPKTIAELNEAIKNKDEKAIDKALETFAINEKTGVIDLNKAINNNHQLSHPSIAPKSRIFFLTKLNEGHDFNKMIKKIYPKTCLKQFVKKLVLTLGLYKK